MDDEYLNAKEAAALLKLSGASTLAKWRQLNQGPPFTRAGDRILYSKARLLQWLAGNEVEPR